jgi:hypothetical protein
VAIQHAQTVRILFNLPCAGHSGGVKAHIKTAYTAEQ